VSRDFTSTARSGIVRSLTHGNELMVEFVGSHYPAHGNHFRVRQHTVDNVLEVLSRDEFGPPDVMRDSIGIVSAADAIPAIHRAALAPTYDHASSLGREISETDRLARLDGKDANRTVQRYLDRAKGRWFRSEDASHPISPMKAFHRAAHLRPTAAAASLDRLRSLTSDHMRRVVERVPEARISLAARRFTQEVLDLNRNDLLTSAPSSHGFQRQPYQSVAKPRNWRNLSA